MSTTLLTIKTDPETKQQVKDFAAELGVTSTAFINMLIRQALRDKRIVLATELEPTPYLEAIMRQADEDYLHDRNITHTANRQEALAHLDSLMSQS